MDANGDGVIDRDEWETAARKKQGREATTVMAHHPAGGEEAAISPRPPLPQRKQRAAATNPSVSDALTTVLATLQRGGGRPSAMLWALQAAWDLTH